MRVIIDHIEGNIAVAELPNREMLDLPADIADIKEGGAIKVTVDNLGESSKARVADITEEGIAVVEMLDGTEFNFPALLMPELKTGDCLRFEVDDLYTAERKARIDRLMNKLWD